MMTLTCEYGHALYINLTNRCDCACRFCLRNHGANGGIYADNLWLEREPARQELLDALLSRPLTTYPEIVFCGFGEPTFRLEDILWLADQLKSQVPGLPALRINTNGHASLILGRDVTPELAGRIDRALHLTQRGHAGAVRGGDAPARRPPRMGGDARFHAQSRPLCSGCADDHRGQRPAPGRNRSLPRPLHLAGRTPARPLLHCGVVQRRGAAGDKRASFFRVPAVTRGSRYGGRPRR